MTEPSANIDAYLAALPRWQRVLLSDFRDTVHRTEPSVTEGWKWNVPVFLYDGKTIFAMAAFKTHVKYNFLLNGAALDDAEGLLDSGTDSKRSRAIDLRDGETVDGDALARLIAESVRMVSQP